MAQYKIVAVDQTDLFEIAPSDRRFIASIEAVALYDAEEVTFACDQNPLHYLYPLYVNVNVHKGFERHAEALWERYGQEPEEEWYMHSSDVAGITGQVDVALKEGQDLEDLLEYYRGNHVL